jgi:hypothetical protein
VSDSVFDNDNTPLAQAMNRTRRCEDNLKWAQDRVVELETELNETRNRQVMLYKSNIERLTQLEQQRNYTQERWDDSRMRVLELEHELRAVKMNLGIANPYLVKDQLIKKLQDENEKLSGQHDSDRVRQRADRAVITELQVENEKLRAVHTKTTELVDYLTVTEDGNKIIGFSKSGAQKHLHYAMHLARIIKSNTPKTEAPKE